MARKTNKKAIVELDKPGGKIIKYWESGAQAAEAYGMNRVIISYNVHGTTTQAKGHYFRFATPKEIEQYAQIIIAIEPKSVEPIPVEPILTSSSEPAEVIPEVVKPNENQSDARTPFERLLEAGKKKLMDN